MMGGAFSYFLTTFVAIFVIVDPFALVPIYLMFGDRYSPEEMRVVRRKAVLIGGGILLTFALSGLGVFKVFGITLPAFQIGGGLLLLQIGIEQLNAKRTRVRDDEKDESMEKDDVSIFPLAMPLIAGPGAISTVVLFSTEAESIAQRVGLIVCVVVVMLLTYGCLTAGPYLYRILGKTGLNLMTRIMGIILAAIGVQFILNGVKAAREAGLF
jgi:multiple antibiotic resistance protein